MNTIPLGFEVGGGGRVYVPLGHTAVTGQTQASGKTTTLEAMVSRAGVKALAFVTKRGEGSFAGGRRVQPYFRDRADWQFVTSILDATLAEKNKFLRPWIIKICRQTKTLADVQREVRNALKTAKGLNEGVYTQLDAYLDLIVPEISRQPLATSLSLQPGLNVMDVGGYPLPMQMLFVQSALDWVNANGREVVTIVPEAWEMVPQGKGSPVKASAEALVRKGAALGNMIWVDSQDMAGVDKTILRGCKLWLIGVQREANEIKRALLNIPAGIKRPKPEAVAMLRRGQFYACWDESTVLTYVQPAWMSEELALQVAVGKMRPEEAAAIALRIPCVPAAAEKDTVVVSIPPRNDTTVVPDPPQPEEQLMPDQLDRLERLVNGMEKFFAKHPDTRAPAGAVPSTSAVVDEEAIYQRFKARLLDEAKDDPIILRLLTTRPELQVQVTRKVMEIDDSTAKGQFAKLIAEGFFDEAVSGQAAFNEMKRRGAKIAKPTVYDFAKRFAADGFLTIENKAFKAVAGVKRNIREK